MTPNNQQALKALYILHQRKKVLDNILKTCFDKQLNFINDKSDLKAALCSRRAGKTFAAGISFFQTGLDYPGCNMLYIGLTRESAKRILCKDIVNVINKKFGVGLTFNKSTLTYTFPNGSILTILGLDADENEHEKILGQKYKLVIIDEAGSFTQDLEDIVYKTLAPSMIDEQGQIVLIGTPQHNKNTLFYKVTNGLEIGWKVHNWHALDNPYEKDKSITAIEKIEKDKPAYKTTPRYKMEYLGQWVADEEGLIYKFNRERNICEDDFYEKDKEKTLHVLGVDLGYDDDTSFVVGNYSNYRPELVIPYVYKKKGMIISDVAEMIKALDTKFNFQTIVIDGANKQAVEELKQRHQLFKIQTANKQGKADFIEICNTDLICKKILFTKDCGELFEEFESLIWDPRLLKKGVKLELSSCDNHLCDAFLYMWRKCYNYVQFDKEVKESPRYGEAAVNRFWDKEEERLDKDPNYLGGRNDNI